MSRVLMKINPRWFRLSQKVVKEAVPKIENQHMPEADIVFATAAVTAESVETLDISKGRKFYLVQSHENWSLTDEEVCRTYHYADMQKVLIAMWMREYMRDESRVTVIPNPIDIREFYVRNSIERRNPYTIAAMYHTGKYKDSKYAIEALSILKKKHTELSARMFGTCNRPTDMPEWIQYKKNARSKAWTS